METASRNLATLWHVISAWYSSAPSGGQDPRDASIAIGCIAAVVWTAGFIYRGLPNARTTLGLIRAMHRLQFAYIAPLIALLATPPWMRTIAAIFFVNSALLLVANTLKRRFGQAPFMKEHLDMIARANDRMWSAHRLESDFAPMAIIFFYPNTTAIAWLSLYLLFTGFQGLLSGLYADLHQKPEPDPPASRDGDTALATAIRALSGELGRRPNPPSVYLSIFGPNIAHDASPRGEASGEVRGSPL